MRVKMKFEVIVSVMLTATMTLSLWASGVSGWMFSDDKKTRPLDGTLRCYQCNSSESVEVCTLNNWKHANVTEKRNMMMQCPRRKSAFCHLVVTEGTDETVRGCSGPTYTTGRTAHAGCFSMSDPRGAWVKRVCLCDTSLCNATPPSSPLTLLRAPTFVLLASTVTYSFMSCYVVC